MVNTISGYTTSPVTLNASSAYASPLTITGTINAGFANALYVDDPWTITLAQSGTLLGDIALYGSAALTLNNAGYIYGSGRGLYLTNDARITNAGSINSSMGGGVGIAGNYSHHTTILNTGYIAGNDGIRTGPGYISNSSHAVINGDYAGIDASAPGITINNAGTILAGSASGDDGIQLDHPGTIINSGTIIGATGIFGSGNIVNSGLIESSYNLGGYGVVFSGAGTFTEDASGQVIGGVYGQGGSNTLALEGGALSNVKGFSQDEFGPHANATLESQSFSYLGTISGFSVGDTIQLDFTTADTGIFLNHILTISEGASRAGTLTFTGNYAADGFTVTQHGKNVDIALKPACFLAGTRIATPTGERPVEDLAIGDLVTTLHSGAQPIKWIGRRTYDRRFLAGALSVLPIRIGAGAIGPKTPARDLAVSPGHALWVEGALIHAHLLVNGVSITQPPATSDIAYLHLEFAGHEIIFAESCPAESYLDNGGRGQFQNEAEFFALHGNPPRPLPRAALLEEGAALNLIRQLIDARAGIAPAAEIAGPLRGFVDQAGPAEITGWAQNPAAPETPVWLEIFGRGTPIARILANRFRADLRAAGLGSGRHSFTYKLPANISGPFEIRRAFDGAVLPFTEAARAA
jgi:hypothetical protein